MHRFLGKAAPPKPPPPTLQDTSKALGAREANLDEKIRKLDKELFEYKKQIKNAKGAASANLKQRALAVLKRKRQLEKQRDQVATQNFNLDQTQFALESIQATKQTIGTMKEASKNMKKELKSINMTKLEAEIDDMADYMEEFEELNETMSRSWGVPADVDETDLDAELAGLDDEVFEEESEQVPDYLKSVPSASTAALPNKAAAAVDEDEQELDRLKSAVAN